MSTYKVTAFIRPYFKRHDLIQLYYREAFKRYLKHECGNYTEISVSRFPLFMKTLWKIKNSYRLQSIIGGTKIINSLIDALALYIEGPIKVPSSQFHSAVGQYILKLKDGSEFNICIDGRDSGEISSYELLQWSDLYFKSNYWSAKSYPQNVFPIINGNPFVLKKLSNLRSFRSGKKMYDLCFIVRAWGGTKDVDGLEHNIRLLEEVSKVDCKKFILAYLVGGDIQRTAQRLDKHGIPYTNKPVPIGKLWKISAQSYLNIIRLGIFYCVPWRMIDMLAMGACPVLDHIPYTLWPQPLRQNINFFSLNLDVGPQQPLAPYGQYEAILAKIENWLSNSKYIENISNNNIDYFDKYIDPQRLGKYLIETIEKTLEAN